MRLGTTDELIHAREKLNELTMRYEALRLDVAEDPRIRRLTMLSLKRLINQLTEEIAWFESRAHRV